MKNTLALVLMVFGIVGCATTIDTSSPEAQEKMRQVRAERLASEANNNLIDKRNLASISNEEKREMLTSVREQRLIAEKLNGRSLESMTASEKDSLLKEVRKLRLAEETPAEKKLLPLLLPSPLAFAECVGDISNYHNCQGTYTYSNGDKYIGEFKDGKKHGQGTYTFAGGKYEGEFKDAKRDGQGTLTFADGLKYEGEWKDDKFYGQVTVTYGNGNKYIGEFKDGKKHGQGTYTYADGNKYIGEYQDGKRNGQGTYTFQNGSKYIGEWKDDNRNGQGTETFYGGKYIGEWKDDKYHGQGTYTYANGRQKIGKWKNDKYQNGMSAADCYEARYRKVVQYRRTYNSLKEAYRGLPSYASHLIVNATDDYLEDVIRADEEYEECKNESSITKKE